jgi:type IV fimbrial biogenesis protein FimT
LLDTEATGYLLMVCGGKRIAGITMIEISVVILVLAVVLTLGVPSITRWARQSEIRSSAESLRSVLQKARAEAISRNTRITVTIGEPSGRARWVIGCVRISALCTASLHQQHASSDSNIRWGAAKSPEAADLSTALAFGAGLPGSVDFFPLGDARRVASGDDLTRIDVMHAADPTVGRLIIQIDSAGNVRICDTKLPALDNRGCH